MAQTFTRRPLPGCHTKNTLKDLSSNISDGGFPVGYPSCIDIHIVAHPAVGCAVARDLDHGNGRKPDGAATAGGEGDEIDPAGGESGERNWVVAGSIHESEPR